MKQNNILQDIYIYLESKGLWSRSVQKVIFLLELKYFQEHKEYLTKANFKSYKYGPYSKSIHAISANESIESYSESSSLSQEIIKFLDEILNEFKVNTFSHTEQEKEFSKLIKYIHSLFIYNVTPFNHKYKLELFDNKDLFLEVDRETELNGKILEQDKDKYKKIDKIEVAENIKKQLFSAFD